MKRLACLAITLMLAFVVVQTPAQAKHDFSDNILTLGDYGSDVIKLQSELYALGLFSGGITGVYDSTTRDSVTQLQLILGIKSDGIYGPLTYSTYNKALLVGIFDSYLSGEGAYPLDGKLIGIDPGHQLTADETLEFIAPLSDRMKERQSEGCVGTKSGMHEYEVTLQIGLKLKALLEASGANVVMTRITNDVNVSNVERAQMMNGMHVDAWVRLHCDSSSDKRHNGVNALVPASQYYNEDIYDESLLLGESVLESFCKATGAKRIDIVALANQAGFNWSSSPVVAIEMGYMSNPQEDVRLCRDSYQQLCASGILRGLIAYFERVDTEQVQHAAETVPVVNGNAITE